MKKIAYAAVLCAFLSACDQGPQQQGSFPNTQNTDGSTQQGTMEQPVQNTMPAPQEASVAEAPTHIHADWEGEWLGVEGTYANIKPASPGNYTIEMQYDLDNLVKVNGIDDGDAIAFMRNGQRFQLRRSKWDQIGLSGLDGRKACLKVQDGEGYCRK